MIFVGTALLLCFQTSILWFSQGVNMWLEHELGHSASACEAKVGNPFILAFPGWSCFMCFEGLGPNVAQNVVGGGKCAGFFPVSTFLTKYAII
jgi:hypothetical protein